MNHYFRDATTWDVASIERRGAALTERALTIWPDLGGESVRAASSPEPGGRPVAVRLRGRSYSVKTWKGVLEATIKALAETDPELPGRLASELPALIRAEPAGFRSFCPLPGGLSLNTHHSAKGVTRWCERILDAAEVAPEDWCVETAP
jgi:hypothetical protein